METSTLTFTGALEPGRLARKSSTDLNSTALKASAGNPGTRRVARLLASTFERSVARNLRSP
jgi:hypothetical protein